MPKNPWHQDSPFKERSQTGFNLKRPMEQVPAGFSPRIGVPSASSVENPGQSRFDRATRPDPWFVESRLSGRIYVVIAEDGESEAEGAQGPTAGSQARQFTSRVERGRVPITLNKEGGFPSFRCFRNFRELLR